jgi:outer membrane protein assembly factor BamB
MNTIRYFVLITSTLLLFSLQSCTDDDVSDPGNTNNPPIGNVGDTLWIHEIEGKDSLIIDNSLAIGKDGAVYFSVSGGTLHWTAARIRALNPENGVLLWESERLDHIALSSQIVVGDDGTVYAIGFYTLYALDPISGATLWTWEVPNELPNPDNPSSNFYVKGQLAGMALTDEGNILTQTSGSGIYNRSIYCINPQGSMLYYNLNANGWGVESGISVGKNNTAYYYSRDINANNQGLNLVAIDTRDGSIRWTKEVFATGCSSNNIAVLDNGNLFCAFGESGTTSLKYRVIDGTNGMTLWTGSSVASSCEAKLIGPSGNYYRDHGAHRINASSGSEELIINVPNSFLTRLSAINSNARLVTAFDDVDNQRKLGVFYSDGLIDFETSVPMSGLEGYNMVISDEKVIFGIVNETSGSRLPSKICAIQSNATLANSGWPRRYHDNRNTSNVNKF